ncbi:tetratricopeptide repeat protein [Flavobacterium selenitireducens]|uniref:tetratricopeptide repeat protein n=1 Tax=Flavobacterium selenitireducens TaxID=2722704 RepID=UPI00168B0124|nr:hypothetical protein [Flavobacterium selenitireducens]MBD3583129.1 hypothetical protein [Flavobacterium selenitireducens]
MKCTYLILAMLFSLGLASAQEKTDKKCKQLQHVVDSLVQKNEYDKAFESWTLLRKTCPTFDQRVYTSGADLLKIRIDRAKVEDKAPLVNELVKIYDDLNKNIPANTEPVLLQKALLQQQYKLASDAEVYAMLDRAFAKNPTQFTDHKAIYLYLQLYFDKFKAGDRTITANKILGKRDDLIAHVERLAAASPASANDATRTIQALQMTVKEVSTCENLDAYYGEAFEKRKSDTLWLGVALKALSDSHCRTSKMFTEITQHQQNLKPTAQSAYNLGSAAYQKAKFDEAEKYFVQSAELSKDPIEKSDTYFTIASTLFSGRDKGRQKQYLDKALEANPNHPKSYILLAQMYAGAGNDCGKNPFEKKALNWLAANTLKKAIAVDKTKTSLEKLVRKYEEQAPSDKEIKQAKMGGMTIYYDCWIKSSVIVPKK